LIGRARYFFLQDLFFSEKIYVLTILESPTIWRARVRILSNLSVLAKSLHVSDPQGVRLENQKVIIL